MIKEDYQIILSDHIVRHILVWLKDIPQPAFYDFQISEILYQDVATNQMHIRLIQLRY